MKFEPIMRTHRAEIKAYCDANDIDFEKLRKCGGFGGMETPFQFQHHEKVDPTVPYDDSKPAPVVLKVELVNDQLVFTQTENTRKYLAKDAT